MTDLATAAHAIDIGAEWTRLMLETFGAVTIAIGAVVAVVGLFRDVFARRSASFTTARFILARYLVLALEFQLAADVLETAIAPEWTKLGQLAAIATIRTALNYFLGRELREERAQVARDSSRTASARE